MTPPLALRRHQAPDRREARRLVVMLPGAGMTAADFAANGLVRALHERHPDIDIVAACPPLELYLDGEAAAALHRQVIEPARAEGYEEIWLLGISLGGMGAILAAALHENRVEGVVLLAPFLGTPGTIAAIEAAGGPARWTASAVTTAPEAAMWRWLRNFCAAPPARPAFFLGYGEADRFARGHRLLGALLPPACVVTLPGGHDWETWGALWRLVLDAGIFGARG